MGTSVDMSPEALFYRYFDAESEATAGAIQSFAKDNTGMVDLKRDATVTADTINQIEATPIRITNAAIRTIFPATTSDFGQ